MDGYGEFKDAGKLQPDYGNDVKATISKPTKMKVKHQFIEIDINDFPYLQGLDVGSTCELKVKIKKTGEKKGGDQYDSDTEKKQHKATLEILQISEPKTSGSAYQELINDGKKKAKER